MTLWHLAWMHLTLLAIFAALGALPFTWWYAWGYVEGERFQRQRFLLLLVWRHNQQVRAQVNRPNPKRHRFSPEAKPREPRPRYEPTEETEEQ